jgi:hypothetical protein
MADNFLMMCCEDKKCACAKQKATQKKLNGFLVVMIFKNLIDDL